MFCELKIKRYVYIFTNEKKKGVTSSMERSQCKYWTCFQTSVNCTTFQQKYMLECLWLIIKIYIYDITVFCVFVELLTKDTKIISCKSIFYSTWKLIKVSNLGCIMLFLNTRKNQTASLIFSLIFVWIIEVNTGLRRDKGGNVHFATNFRR